MTLLGATHREMHFDSWACWLVLALAVCMPSCQRDESATMLPDFTLPQVRGGVFHLRSGHPQAVLLAFLQTVPDATDTQSRQQMGFLLSMNHQYSMRGLKVVIVDSSALVTHQPPKHDALINASYDWQLDIPLLEDDDNRVARSWGITQAPMLILLASDGSIAQHWSGVTGPAILANGIEKVCSGSSVRGGDSAP
jgi:peroxiredoxin